VDEVQEEKERGAAMLAPQGPTCLSSALWRGAGASSALFGLGIILAGCLSLTTSLVLAADGGGGSCAGVGTGGGGGDSSVIGAGNTGGGPTGCGGGGGGGAGVTGGAGHEGSGGIDTSGGGTDPNAFGGQGGASAGANGQDGASAFIFAPFVPAGGGGGGGGAHGAVVTTSIVNSGNITGGKGGNGGFGGTASATGGGGGGGAGAGGYGVVVGGSALTFSNVGTLNGGNGGNGGAAGDGTGGFGNDGGNGIVFTGSGTLVNSGSIVAGNGGAAGVGSRGNGATGAGGIGVVGGDLMVINNGSISGGLNGDGSTRSSAIQFTTGSNVLELQAGSSITGAVVGVGADTLQLGGTVNSTFDVSAVGFQYTGFQTFVKTGTSTWTLTGASPFSPLWTINQGTLAISSDAPTSGFTFNGGTLQFLAALVSGRTVAINAGGGSFDTESNNVTLTGAIGGAGSLTKIGAGKLTLSGANTYTGATTIAGGTLALSGNGSIATSSGVADNGTFDISAVGTGVSIQTLSGTGTVTLGANTLTLSNASSTYSGAIGGSGGLTLTTGTEMLFGTNTYTGATTISGGTLALSGNGSIATSNGVADNGTFDISAASTGVSIQTLSGTGTVTLGANTLTLSNANSTYSGAIGGSGGLTLTTGTETLSGTLSYQGNTIVNGGTLHVTNAFTVLSTATLTVNNTGTYTIDQLLTNSGAIQVNAGGTLTATAGGITNNFAATILNNGRIDDTLHNAGTVTNNLTYNADVGTNTGTITNANNWNGDVLSNAGRIFNAASATWTGNISTGGTFTNAGIVTGTLSNTAGTTTNNGSISGAVTVSGGTFKGTGSSGGLTIGSGAVFAPGNGTPGTSATVNGNLAFSSGAFYQVAINPTTASFVSATGTATLGGASVQAFFSSGAYVAKQYTILSAGSVRDTFNGPVNSNLPSGFKAALSYDPTHAYLDLSLAFIPPPGTGLNANQQNVGNAIINFFNTNGSIPLVFGGLTPASLTQISGETATGSQQTTFNAMGQFMGVMTDPFIAGRNDPVSAGGNPNAYADEASLAYAARGSAATRNERDAYAAIYRKASPGAPSFEQRWSVWAAGFGGSQTTDGNAGAVSNNTSSSIYGTAVGADYRISPFTIAGFALAGGGTSFSVAGGGSGHSDLFQAGAFVRHTVGTAYISGALAYGWQDITTNRKVSVAGIDQLRAEFNANTFSGRVEGGYRFVSHWIGGVGITPYAAGQFTTFDLPAYAESVVTGIGNFALAYGAKNVTDSRSELGFRTDKSFATPDAILTLRGRFAWAHDYDPSRSVGATFQSLPGASFVVNGAAQASESALTTASAELKWTNNWSVAATFEGEFSNVTSSYAGKGVVRYAW
jgi:autotransporter-associated beta strand protein